jgi:hypothetical protein
MSVPRYATTERVAVAWLATLAGVTSAMVDTELPDLAVTDWSATGFLVVTAVGGTSAIEFPLAHPLVSVQCFAVSADTGVPPWNAAGNLAATIDAGCFAPTGVGQFVTLPNCDENARVLSAYTTGIPRRSYGDMGDYACMVTQLALHWTTR